MAPNRTKNPSAASDPMPPDFVFSLEADGSGRFEPPSFCESDGVFEVESSTGIGNSLISETSTKAEEGIQEPYYYGVQNKLT